MNKQEFLKKIDDMRIFAYEETSVDIKIELCNQIKIQGFTRPLLTIVNWMSDDYIGISMGDRRCIYTNYNQLLELVLEFIKTPLRERIVEKKYMLILNKDVPFIGATMGDSLGLIQPCPQYKFDKQQSSSFCKKVFTQGEINELPFDMSLFVKEEVK